MSCRYVAISRAAIIAGVAFMALPSSAVSAAEPVQSRVVTPLSAPIPSPKPMLEEPAANTSAHARNHAPAEIRVVGWRFLPDADDDLDLRAMSHSTTHPFNEMVAPALAMLGDIQTPEPDGGESLDDGNTETASAPPVDGASVVR